MQFDIITIFPKAFNSYFSESILKRARTRGLIKIKIHNLRDYALNKHKTVDDRPYGGGPGMILKVEPIYRALKSIKKLKKSKIILLTPQGQTLNQKLAQRLSKSNQLILICGRYEGFDERVRKFVNLELSIGNYILSGGELASMVVVEAISRLIPKVLGHKYSTKDETFSYYKDYIEYPQYTRPPNFKGLKVPKILLSGHHERIKKWRQQSWRKK